MVKIGRNNLPEIKRSVTTGEPSVGKTAWIRQLSQKLNPHRYQVIYMAETDFGRFDLYRQLATELGLELGCRNHSK